MPITFNTVSFSPSYDAIWNIADLAVVGAEMHNNTLCYLHANEQITPSS